VEVHSLTLSYTPGSMRCDSRASLLAHTFASPYFHREPKARVATSRPLGNSPKEPKEFKEQFGTMPG